MDISKVTQLLAALVPVEGEPITDCFGNAYPLPKSLPLRRQVLVTRMFSTLIEAESVKQVAASFGADRTDPKLLRAALTVAEKDMAELMESPAELANIDELVATAQGRIDAIKAALDTPEAPGIMKAITGMLNDDEVVDGVVKAFEAAHPAIVKKAIKAATEAGEEAEGADDVFSGEVMLLEGLVPFFASAAQRMADKAGMLQAVSQGTALKAG